MIKLLQGLNDKQRQAVTTTQGPLAVIAGAGSGKTRVLTRRVAYLIQVKHVPAKYILALTFTNKAAREMKSRITKLIGTKSDVTASTFHSLGLKILHHDGDKIGYRKHFTIMGPSTQVTTVKNILGRELNVNTKQYDPKHIHGAISMAKNELLTPDQYAKRATNSYKRIIAEAYRLYQTELKSNQEVDFDDLIMQPVLLFKKHPEVLHKYQEQFHYISVDEYQDTNDAQYQMVRLLAGKYHNLFVVGDADQSIYGWRGADIGNILDFKNDFPHAKQIIMNENYRSTQSILDAANSLINYNQHRIKTSAWTKNGAGEKVTYCQAQTSQLEAKYIIDQISLDMSKYHCGYGSFAILYRTNVQSGVMQDELFRHGIDYKVYGGKKFFDRAEVQDILAYLALILNPDDSISFERIVNVPRRGIGDKSLGKFEYFANQNGWNLLKATQRIDDELQISDNAKSALAKFGKMIYALRDDVHKERVHSAIESVLNASGYLDRLHDIATGKALKKPNQDKMSRAQNRIQGLYEFLAIAKNFDKDKHYIPLSTRLSAFLNHIQLASSQDQVKDTKSSVSLMTIHAAKGLEFPIVFIIGMSDGIFPSKRNFVNKHNLEEERRVAYVGMTRAEKKLYLTCARESTVYGGRPRVLNSSIFIREIDQHYIHRVILDRDKQGNDIA